MSATIGAALKKIAVYLATNKKALKVIGGIIIGIIIIIEEYRDMIKGARNRTKFIGGSFRYADAENAKDMIYALCDGLDDPKEIMCHVRTADEMLAVWEADSD